MVVETMTVQSCGREWTDCRVFRDMCAFVPSVVAAIAGLRQEAKKTGAACTCLHYRLLF